MSSIAALKKELKALGVDAKTPGLKGDARRDELRRRLQEASAAPAPERRPPRPSGRKKPSERVTNATISALKAALDSLGVDTKTPGIRGEERKRALEERLAAVHAPEDSDEGEGAGGSEAREAEEEDEAYEEMGELWAEEAARRKRRHAQQQRSMSAQRSGSFTHRDSPSKPMTGGASKSSGIAAKEDPPAQPHLARPSSAPLSHKNTVPSVRAPWAVRTRVGRGRGRSRGACRGGPSRRGRKSYRGTNAQRRPLQKRDSSFAGPGASARPASNRSGPPVSARLTARLTSFENRLADAESAVADRRAEIRMQRSLCQKNKEAAARLRSIRESRVAERSDPARNADLADLVDRLNAVRSELKELDAAQQKASSTTSFQQFHSKCLNKKNPDRSILVPTVVAFRELEAMERTLDDAVDRVCSRIVQQEEAHVVHGVQMEASVELEAEKAHVAAERLQKGLASIEDAERVARSRLNDELERRARKPPHIGAEAVKDPLKLAENAQFLWEVRDDPETADRVFTQAVSHLLVFVACYCGPLFKQFLTRLLSLLLFFLHPQNSVPRSLVPQTLLEFCTSMLCSCTSAGKPLRKGSSTRRLPACGSGPSCWHRATLIF